MDLTATLDAACTLEHLRVWVGDLSRYPEWLTIVPRAESEQGSIPSAWAVELRAKVGPIARSKRLRMVRTIDDPGHIRFEREEIDGRSHSSWVLDAVLESSNGGARLTMGLHYGGSFGAGLFERLLADEIEASKQTLRSLVE
jgi:hypothetical protein